VHKKKSIFSACAPKTSYICRSLAWMHFIFATLKRYKMEVNTNKILLKYDTKRNSTKMFMGRSKTFPPKTNYQARG
jgi:hypothetical protein